MLVILYTGIVPMSPEHEKSLRLCHLSKWSHFDGYGFYLHSEKSKTDHFIGKVDSDSPAEAAGLKEGDRIIEVNGLNVCNEDHKHVVERIKTLHDETELLVVDPAGDAYFKSKNIELNSTCSFAVRMTTPTGSKGEDSEESTDQTDSAKPSINNVNHVKSEEEENKVDSTTPVPEPSQEEVITEKMIQNNTLNLNMTARELRAQLAARKKYDPKKDYSLDVKKKYDIVQKL